MYIYISPSPFILKKHKVSFLFEQVFSFTVIASCSTVIWKLASLRK